MSALTQINSKFNLISTNFLSNTQRKSPGTEIKYDFSILLLFLAKSCIPTCLVIITIHEHLIQSFLARPFWEVKGNYCTICTGAQKVLLIVSVELMTEKFHNRLFFTKDWWIFVYQVMWKSLLCKQLLSTLEHLLDFCAGSPHIKKFYGFPSFHLCFQASSKICNFN